MHVSTVRFVLAREPIERQSPLVRHAVVAPCSGGNYAHAKYYGHSGRSFGEMKVGEMRVRANERAESDAVANCQSQPHPHQLNHGWVLFGQLDIMKRGTEARDWK